MGKCPNCGNKLSNLDVLCPRCGALVEVVQNKNNIHADSGDTSSIIKPQKSEPQPYKIVKEPDSPAETISDKLSDFSFVPNDNHEKSIDDSKPLFNFDDKSKINIDKENTQPIETNAKDETRIKADTPADLPSQKSMSEGAFSLGYIHSIKNMPLPELENLDDFDPEEFIRQYRQKNKKKAYDIKQENIKTEKADSENNLDKQPNSLWFDEAASKNSKTENMQPSLAAEETHSSLAAEKIQPSLAAEETQPSLAAEETKKEIDKESKKKIKHEKKEKQRMAKAIKTVDGNKAPHVVGRIPVFLTIIIWILVTGALFGGFFFLDSYVKTTFGGYGSFIYEISDGKINLNTNDVSLQNNINVSVTQTRDDDGTYAHLFEVTARNGVSVNVMPLNDTFNLKQGYAQILIPDYELARSLNLITYENQHITNDIIFEVKSKKSSYTYNIEGLELFLVKAKYTKLQPLGPAITTYENFFTLDITVLPDTKVYIDEIDYSSYIDESGFLKTNISLEKFGAKTFAIDIIQPGFAAVKDTFTVTRQESPTKLIPDSNYLRVYYNAFECLGLTDPTAKVTANIGDKKYVAEINKEGRYSVVCYIEAYGLHHMQLTAASKDKANTTAALTIEYVPEVYTFIAEARESAIDEILVDYKTLQSIPLSVKGSIKNISIGDEVQNFVFYSEDDEMDCYYYGPLQLTQDREYTMYGIYDTDASSFYAMYVS